MKKVFILLVPALVVIIGGAVGYLVWTRPSSQPVAGLATATPSSTTSPSIPPAVSSPASPTTLPSGASVFINEPHRLSFIVPPGYLVESNNDGVTDPAKAQEFFIRKKSDNYADVPTLNVVAKEPLSDQPLEQLVRSMYDENKAKNYTASEIQIEKYAGTIAYLFDLKDGYENQGEYQRLDLPLARVVFLEHNGKIFEFLQTGVDLGLESILTSLKFQ